jgi:mono/diheme cytochrome c family protein
MNHKFVIVLYLLLLAVSSVSWAADDGADLYKRKCSGCHGGNGEAKSALKAPTLKGTDKSIAQLVEHITKGESTSKPPHSKGIPGLTEDQAKSIAEYIKTLQ